MKMRLVAIGIAGLGVAGCSDHITTPNSPGEDIVPRHGAALGAIVLDPTAPPIHELLRLWAGASRTEIGAGLAHYQFDVPLGPGEFDVVRLHRVVREHRPGHPVRTDGAVFMTHGASLTFQAIYLRAGAPGNDPQQSAALSMADRGIDVWGLDFAWTLVPLATSDFSFMQDWGAERDVDHTLAAMSIARAIRRHTGNGVARMPLLGFSYSVGVVYAAAGRETQQPPLLRDVGGLIAVDALMKYAPSDEDGRLASCGAAANIKSQMDAGRWQNADGITFGLFSNLATTAPDDPSPFIPGLTNHQAALFAGANTFVFAPPPAPFWHFVAGDFNESGIPDGLLYSDPSRWIALLGSLPPYMPNRARFEARASHCDEEEVSIDDHLGRITVPILYLGAGGGLGTLGDFTGALTASDDVTNHTVSLQPEANRIIDYGHADLFLGDEAAALVWEVLRRWLVERAAR